jgi:hypothetical protein
MEFNGRTRQIGWSSSFSSEHYLPHLRPQYRLHSMCLGRYPIHHCPGGSNAGQTAVSVDPPCWPSLWWSPRLGAVGAMLRLRMKLRRKSRGEVARRAEKASLFGWAKPRHRQQLPLSSSPLLFPPLTSAHGTMHRGSRHEQRTRHWLSRAISSSLLFSTKTGGPQISSSTGPRWPPQQSLLKTGSENSCSTYIITSPGELIWPSVSNIQNTHWKY